MASEIILDTRLIKRESDFFSRIFRLGLLHEDEISQRIQLNLFKGVVSDTELEKLREQLSVHEELKQGKPLSIKIS